MNKIFLTILLIFLFSLSGKAQKNSSLRLHMQGYNLVFPGVEIAYQYPIINHIISEEKQNKFVAQLSPVVDFYVQKNNHTGIGLMGELSLQYQSSQRINFEIYGGFGILAGILAGEIYEQNAQGDFEKSNFKGNIYQSWKAGLGISKSVLSKKGRMLSYHLRLGARYAKTPGAITVSNVSFGIIYTLSKKEN